MEGGQRAPVPRQIRHGESHPSDLGQTPGAEATSAQGAGEQGGGLVVERSGLVE